RRPGRGEDDGAAGTARSRSWGTSPPLQYSTADVSSIPVAASGSLLSPGGPSSSIFASEPQAVRTQNDAASQALRLTVIAGTGLQARYPQARCATSCTPRRGASPGGQG